MAILTGSKPKTGSASRADTLRQRFYVGKQDTVEVRLDLAPIRDELGTKWDQVASSVRRYALHVVTGHIRNQGSVSTSGDVLCIQLTGVSRSAANDRLENIEQDLYRLLFGSDTAAEPALRRRPPRGRRRRRRRVRAFLSRWAKKFKGVLSTKVESGGTAAVRSGSGHASGPNPQTLRSTEPESAEGGRTSPSRELHANGAEEGSRPASTDNNGAAALGPRISAPAGAPAAAQARKYGVVIEEPTDTGVVHHAEDDPASKIPAGSSQMPDRVRRSNTNLLERALYAAVQEAERQNELARQVRTFPPLGTQFLYRGLWRIEKGIMPIFTCLPACALGPFEFLTGEAIVQGNTPAKLLALLDEMLLDHVIRDVARQNPRDIGSIICVPVHYESLALDGGIQYCKLLEKYPPALRHRLILEIVNLSIGIGQIMTLNIVNRLRPYCYAVVGRLSISEQTFDPWREMDLFAVGVDIETYVHPEAQTIDQIDRFVTTASRAGYHTYVRGVRSRSLAAGIATNGVQFIDGPAIDEGGVGFPAAPLPFGVANIYTDL